MLGRWRGPDSPSRVSIGSGLQEIVLLEPLNDLPATWTKADLPQSPSGDSVFLVRLLVKNGLVAGETDLSRLTVDTDSLLTWAESTARASFGESLPSSLEGEVPEGSGETAAEDQPEPDDVSVCENPEIPEREWSPRQLGMLWLAGLLPCGTGNGLLLLTPLQELADCPLEPAFLSEVFAAPVALVALATDPVRHRELALAWWDRFWQCDERQYAARTLAEEPPPTEPVVGCCARRLIWEAFGSTLGRGDSLAHDQPVPIEPGNGQMLRTTSMLLASVLSEKEGHARLSVERTARRTDLALTTLGPDGEEQARSLLVGTWVFGPPLPPQELLLQVSVLAGLSLRTWDDEGETVLPWFDNQCLRVQAKRSLAGVYGPVLDLRWAVRAGGFLAPEQPVPQQTAKAPPALGRLVTAFADWQGRYRFALLAMGIVLFLFGMLVPGQHGLPSGIALVWTGMVCCLELRRQEPGIWMLSGLAWAGTLFLSAASLYGAIHDLRPDAPGSTLVEEWLVVLVFLAPNLYLWDRTHASLRRDRAVRQAIQPKG